MIRIKNASMKEYSNMKIGGIAKELIFIENKEELKEILSENEDFFILGNGTNTLINDGNINKVFINLNKINKIEKIKEEDGKIFLKVGAGLKFNDLIKYMMENDYTGLEELAGIPGTVGGLVFMNGGSYGKEIFDCISEVEISDKQGNIKILKKEEIEFRYRHTEIKEKSYIIINAIFEFEKGFNQEKVKELVNKRIERHPLDYPNLGSTFKNPNGDFAARLISEAGLKKFSVGGAEVSEKHPNFIVNKNNAKFEDIIKILEEVKTRVKEKFNIELEEEIIIIK